MENYSWTIIQYIGTEDHEPLALVVLDETKQTIHNSEFYLGQLAKMLGIGEYDYELQIDFVRPVAVNLSVKGVQMFYDEDDVFFIKEFLRVNEDLIVELEELEGMEFDEDYGYGE